MVCVSFLDYCVDISLCDFLWLPANLCGQCLLMDIEDHANEALGLVPFEDATTVSVVLGPDLIDDVLDNQLILRFFNVLLD